jgi:hypothetical protein
MSNEKQKVIKATSPKGTMQWFKLVTPDKKFNKYSVDLIVDDTPEIRKIIEVMEQEIERRDKEELEKATEKKDAKRLKLLAAMKAARTNPIEPQLDANKKETGKFVMKFRMPASGKKKDDTVYTVAPPALFNAKAQPYSAAERAGLKVFNGSIGQVNFEISTYAVATGAVGATLKPKAAMILKIQQSEDASQYGFAASELDQDEEASSEFESAPIEEQVEGSANQDF